MTKVVTTITRRMWKMNFWHRVEKQTFGDKHWIWMGGRTALPNREPYGVSTYHGNPYVMRLAHRIAYELTHKVTLSRRDRLFNMCGENLCVRPDHWQLNMSRIPTVDAPRDRTSNEKIDRNLAIVKERQQYPNRSMAKIGKKHGITRQAVEQILRRYSVVPS